jgi:hypothetical protein
VGTSNGIIIYGNLDAFLTCPFNTNYYCANLENVYQSSGSSSQCVARLPVGAYCPSSYQCQSHICINQVCISQNPNNGVCTSSVQCSYDSYCSNKACVKRLTYNSACNDSSQCYSNAECINRTCIQLFTIEDNQPLHGFTKYYSLKYLCKNLFLNANQTACGNITERLSLVYNSGRKSRKCNSNGDCEYFNPIDKKNEYKTECILTTEISNGANYCRYGGPEQVMMDARAAV